MKILAGIVLILWVVVLTHIAIDPGHNAKGYHVLGAFLGSLALVIWVLAE